MKHSSAMSVALTAFATIGVIGFGLGESGTAAFAQAQPARAREIPKFQVDPSWPKLPGKWVFGQVSSVSIDERNHAWVLLDSFGRPGVAPGEFYVLHHMNVDTQGNLYVTEVQDGKRTQKFVFKGLVTAPSN